jgi:hypothetical protein
LRAREAAREDACSAGGARRFQESTTWNGLVHGSRPR